MKLLVLDSNTWNHLTMYKQLNSGLFKNCYLETICLQIIHTQVSYNNWCLYNSTASNKAFIRWWLWVQAWFRGWSIITTSQECPSSISWHHQTLSDCCHSMGLPYPCWCSYTLILDLFRVFPLVWWRKSKISQENGGWVGNETSASNFDRKYICYPAISDTLFSQILIFFQLTLMYIYIYVEDLALNNLWWLICCKTQPTNHIAISISYNVNHYTQVSMYM